MEAPVYQGCRSRSGLADRVLVTSREAREVWSIGTPNACLLLSKFVPANARAFAEFRRLRDGLPRADACIFATWGEEQLPDAGMVAAARPNP